MSERHQVRVSDWTPGADETEARALLSTIVASDIERLVSIFYDTFLGDKEASAFLSHSVVQDRLSGSLRNWLLTLLDDGDEKAFAERQMKIGNVHARIKIPLHLVLQGASILKSRVGMQLGAMDLSGHAVATALVLLDERIDLAMRLMSEAYVSGTMKGAQVDEAYRLFSLGQDISIEREAQRAALMEWSQQILFGLFGQNNASPGGTISASPFGLWLRHRAAVLFNGLPALDSIEATMLQIDRVLLPQIEDARAGPSGSLDAPLRRLQAAIEEVKFLLGEMFQATSALENGRDPLTRALNRRFLPSILGREIALAGTNETPLSLLMIDIDHFKQINDQWGHSAGDLVLRQIAEVILENVRLSDFVFRYGGEEFLVVLVETEPGVALGIAERIRTAFMEREFRLPDSGRLQATASIGVASYQGHPDYAYLIDAADRALYKAKKAGRNCVMTA